MGQFYNQEIQNKQNLQSTTPITYDTEKYKFFTSSEIAIFEQDNIENIILKMDNGMPFLNYEVSKRIFESVVGGNYNLEIVSFEYVAEFETFTAHTRFTLERDNKKIVRDVIGCEKISKNQVTNEPFNFHNLPKSAVKDAFKKFLNDYMGIGAIQYAKAKKEYEDMIKKEKLKKLNNNSTGESYFCSDCNTPISPKVYTYSVNYHSEKRPLCPTCQKKY